MELCRVDLVILCFCIMNIQQHNFHERLNMILACTFWDGSGTEVGVDPSPDSGPTLPNSYLFSIYFSMWDGGK